MRDVTNIKKCSLKKGLKSRVVGPSPESWKHTREFCDAAGGEEEVLLIWNRESRRMSSSPHGDNGPS